MAQVKESHLSTYELSSPYLRLQQTVDHYERHWILILYIFHVCLTYSLQTDLEPVQNKKSIQRTLNLHVCIITIAPEHSFCLFLFFQPKGNDNFLLFPEHIGCEYSLEVHH